jgi:hypothetical protein
MGWLKRILNRSEKEPVTLAPGKTGASENLIRNYCKIRYELESGISKAFDIDDAKYKRCKALHRQLTESGVDAESRYQRFKAERKSLPKEQADALDVAEDIYQEPTENEEVTVYKPVKRGEEIVTKRETQTIRSGGAVVARTVITIPVAACGKRLSSQEQIAGFCAVCDEAVCSEHATYCTGFNDFPCGKLLCRKDTIYFTDAEGERKPFCNDHYNMKYYRQASIPESDSKREKKPKNLEKDDGRFER